MSTNGTKRLLRYAGCAVAVMFAATTQQYWMAAITCSMALVE